MKHILFSFLLLLGIRSFAQDAGSVKIFNSSSHQKPLLVYFTGDGGFNNFTTALCNNLVQSGYDIVAVNSKSYFWKKKTPAQTAAFIQPYIQKYLAGRPAQSVVLIGYSFGADVMPFIYNSLPSNSTKFIEKMVLLAPSPTTDFEIHLLDMSGSSSKYNMDVVAEIKKIKTLPIYAINGTQTDFPYNDIKTKNFYNTTVKGDFHFSKDPKTILPIIYKVLN